MKYFRVAILINVFMTFAALLSGCVAPSSYYPDQYGYNNNSAPQNRADELIQRVAGGTLGHTVRTQNESGNYSAEATVLKEYQSDGRTCKDVHHKIIFEEKTIENKTVSVCFYNGANTGWYLPETRVAQQQRHNPYQSNPMFPYAQQPAWMPMGYGQPYGSVPAWQRGMMYMNQPAFYGGFQFSR
jgi:hypothetical protein